MNYPAVLKDHNAKTMILVSVGPKWASVIQHDTGELVLRKIPIKELDLYTVLDYSVVKACFQYQFHAGGVTAKAREAMNAIVSAEADKLPMIKQLEDLLYKHCLQGESK